MRILKNNRSFEIRKIRPEDNRAMAALIRGNLKSVGLDIPGTAYFDSVLDSLSEFYSPGEGRGYYVLTDENGKAVGGIGYDRVSFFESCAELQKLYLCDSVKGMGLGYSLIAFIENMAAKDGYRRMYLETHSVLGAAVHMYKKSDYTLIDRPEAVVHSAMNMFFIKELKQC